jgi:hypothetical protein
MRYRLRTLLIVLALGPPAAGLAWMVAAGMRVHPVLLGAGIYAFLVLVLVGASWGLERVEKSRLARAMPWRTRPAGRCDYCGTAQGPLAEGAAGVLICRDCARACLDLLEEERQKREAADGA